MKRKILLDSLLGFLILSLWGCISAYQPEGTGQDDDYHVAAFYWPSMQDDPRSREVFWGEGIGEWEMIRKGEPLFKGHYQPRVPLWGYELDNDPGVMEKKIDAAADHGIDIFIFDWFWFDGEPFLESTLNDGFLKAGNRDRMEFFLFWGNHDATNGWNRHRYPYDTIIWEGEVDWENYRIIVDRVINRYFKQPNYYKIDGKPVFSLFDFGNLVKSFDGLEGTREALDYFREETEQAGLPGLHLLVEITRYAKYMRDRTRSMEGNELMDHIGFLSIAEREANEIMEYLGINSVTVYSWGLTNLDENYVRWAEGGVAYRERWDSILQIPVLPNVSMGWDNSLRHPDFGREHVVHLGNSPESFGMYLQEAREFLDQRPEQPPLIILNAWNEWIEGSYLEPDMKWGYGYLEAVKKIMSGKYDRN